MITIEQIQVKLADAIKQNKMSQIEIAHRLNVNPATISHYIHGTKMPALETFANLCDILNIDTNYILCIGENKKDK